MIRNVKAWLEEAGLTLAAHKTESVLISSRKIVEKLEVSVAGTIIESKRTIKYLTVIIDDSNHVKFIDEKASVTQGALTRMMPNIGEPNSFKRRIICYNVDNVICFLSMVRGTLRGHDKQDTVIGVSSKGD